MYPLKIRLALFLRNYLYSPLGCTNFILKLPFVFLSLIFGWVVVFRRFLYRKGLFKEYRAPFKVISIGGLTLGGQGKTTLTLKMAQHLLGRGLKVAIVVGKDAQDEEHLLNSLGGLEVYRREVKSQACKEIKGRDVVVLDDGFQHLRIKRDLDIVLISCEEWRGNKFLLPAGPWREPLSSLKYAHIVGLLSFKSWDGLSRKIFREKLCRWCKDIFFLEYRLKGFIDTRGNSYPQQFLRGKRIGIFSGIGNPRGLRNLLESLGPVFMWEKVFPDHYQYTLDDWEEIRRDSQNTEYLITTLKDYMRLKKFPPEPKLLMPQVEIRIIEEEAFFRKADEILSKDH